MKHPIKRRLARVVLFAVAILLSLGLLEGLCSAWAWMRYGTLSVAQLNDLDTGNVYVNEPKEGYLATIMPHPYLAICQKDQWANNVGTRGRDFPLFRDDQYFTILVTGGSVADQLCAEVDFEAVLNQICDFGKPIRVLNGGGGGWNEPNQMIMLGLYGEVADAVISVDGFNEHWTILGYRERIEVPSPNFTILNPQTDADLDNLAAAWQSNRLREYSLAHNSRALYFATRILRNRLEASVESPATDVLTVKQIFSLPQKWTREQRTSFNIEQYKKYIRLAHGMSKELGIKEAHFIQPVPAIGKKLTLEEQRAVGDLSYADTYLRIESELLTLNESGVPVTSLVHCFDDVSETVYVDLVHCGKDTIGYRVMAEQIANELNKQWSKPAGQ